MWSSEVRTGQVRAVLAASIDVSGGIGGGAGESGRQKWGSCRVCTGKSTVGLTVGLVAPHTLCRPSLCHSHPEAGVGRPAVALTHVRSFESWATRDLGALSKTQV